MSKTLVAPSIFSVFGKGIKVDREKRVIYGLAVATRGPALGHDEKLDDITLKQIVELGNRAPVRCRIDHPDQPDGDHIQIANKLEKLVGLAKNFRIDGDVVRADCYMLPSDAAPISDRLLALAESPAAELFGVSMVHASRVDKENNVRLETLFALDFVDFPAANPTGLFSAGSEGGNMSPLETYEKDGKTYVDCPDGKTYEIAPAKKEVDEEEEKADVETDEEEEEEKAGAMSIKAAQEKGRKEEREYRVAFDTAVNSAGIKGEDADKFRIDFYGLDIKQVKFLAANAIAARAKPVGESGGETAPADKAKADEKKFEDGLRKRFDTTPAVRKLWTQDANPRSEAYKVGFARYFEAEKKWAEDQKPENKKRQEVESKD